MAPFPPTATRSPDLIRSPLLAVAVLAVAYGAASYAGQRLAYLPPGTITAVFPASGVAVAALLIGGSRLWPGVWIGSLAANTWALVGGELSPRGIACGAAVAFGASLQAVVGAALARGWTESGSPFGRARDAGGFIIAIVASCLLNPSVGSLTLWLFGFAESEALPELALTWYLGDVSGALLAAPLLLAWGPSSRRRKSGGSWAELLILGILPFVVGQAVVRTHYPLEYLYLPLFTWAAFRFGPRGATALTGLIAGIAVTATVEGFGSFHGATKNESLMLLQSFLGTISVTTLLLLGVISARDTAERGLAEALESLEARVRLRTHELAATNGRLRRIADCDPLTGVANRRAFDELLDREWRRHLQEGSSLSVLLLDIDHFKTFNDTFGHPAGDDCLRRVADALASALQRDGEVLARYGGEEFVALIPNADWDEALRIAERLRKHVAATAIPHAVPPGVVTFSAGVAASKATFADAAALLAAADEALYEAKHAGRNQAVAAKRP